MVQPKTSLSASQRNLLLLVRARLFARPKKLPLFELK
jgi:hypothetical protein